MNVLKPLASAAIIAAATVIPSTAAHADLVPPTCLAVEVSSSSGDFCVAPTLDPTTVSASGDATITNNTPAEILAFSDVGAGAAIPPHGSTSLSASNSIV